MTEKGNDNQAQQVKKPSKNKSASFGDVMRKKTKLFVKINKDSLEAEFGSIKEDDLMFGGMAYVLPFKASKKLADQCEDLKEGLECIVKMPHELNPTYIQRFDREKYFSMMLEHKNIVKSHKVNKILLENDLGHKILYPYIVQEKIQGKSLRQILVMGKPFTLEHALKIDEQSNSAYKYMHGRGVAHCDGSIDNLLITSQGIVKIIDPGIARDLNSENPNITAAGIVFGAPYIMPPESWRGERGKFTDDWISGSVQYIIIGKRTVFDMKKEEKDKDIKSQALSEDDIKFFIHELDPRIGPEYAACIMQRLDKDTSTRLTIEETSQKIKWLRSGKYHLYHPQYNQKTNKFDIKVNSNPEKFEENIQRLKDFNELLNYEEFMNIAAETFQKIHVPFTFTFENDKYIITNHPQSINERLQAIDKILEISNEYHDYLLNSRKKSKKTTSGQVREKLKKLHNLFNGILEKDKHYYLRFAKRYFSNFIYLPDEQTICEPTIIDGEDARTAQFTQPQLEEAFGSSQFTDTVIDEDAKGNANETLDNSSRSLPAKDPTNLSDMIELPKPSGWKKYLIAGSLVAALGIGGLYLKKQKDDERMSNSLNQSFVTLEECLGYENLNLERAEQLMDDIKNNKKLSEFIDDDGNLSLRYSNIKSEFSERIRIRDSIENKLNDIGKILNDVDPKIGEADKRLKELEENEEYQNFIKLSNRLNELYKTTERKFKETISEVIQRPLSNAEEALQNNNLESARTFIGTVETYMKRLNPVDHSEYFTRLSKLKKVLTDADNLETAKSDLNELRKAISNKEFQLAKERISSLDDYLTKYDNKEIKDSVNTDREFVQKCLDSLEKLPEIKTNYQTYNEKLANLKEQDVVEMTNNTLEAFIAELDTMSETFNSLEPQAFKTSADFSRIKTDIEVIIKAADNFEQKVADGKYSALKVSINSLNEITRYLDQNYFKSDCSKQIEDGNSLDDKIKELLQGYNKVLKDKLSDNNYDEYDTHFRKANTSKENYKKELRAYNTFVAKKNLAAPVMEDREPKYTSEQQEAAEFILKTFFREGAYSKGLELKTYFSEENKPRAQPFIDVMEAEIVIRDTNKYVKVTTYMMTETSIDRLEELIKGYSVDDEKVIKFNDELISLSEKIKSNGNYLKNIRTIMNDSYDKLNDVSANLNGNQREALENKYNAQEKKLIGYVNQLVKKAKGDLSLDKKVPPDVIRSARDAWFRVAQIYIQAGADKNLSTNAYTQARTYNSQFLGLLPAVSNGEDKFSQLRNEASEMEGTLKEILDSNR